MKTQVFVGLDVSKQHLDVAVRPQGRHFVTPNNDRGIKQLVKRLAALKPQLIVMEASGGYEFLATAALAEAQLACGPGQSPGGAEHPFQGRSLRTRI
jgi:transposase